MGSNPTAGSKMAYTYLIKSLVDHSYYTGITSDPIKRLEDHNSGKLKTTSSKKPWCLVFFRKHKNYADARKHEKWLKKKSRVYKDQLAQLAPPIPGGVKQSNSFVKSRSSVQIRPWAPPRYRSVQTLFTLRNGITMSLH